MNPFVVGRDTIGRRVASSIVSTVTVTVALAYLLVHLAGVWARPSEQFFQANYIMRLIEATPARDRAAVASATTSRTSFLTWYSTADPISARFNAAVGQGVSPRLAAAFLLDGKARPLVAFRSKDPLSLGLARGMIPPSRAYFLAVRLRDKSWLTFTSARTWGLNPLGKTVVFTIFLAVFVLISSTITTLYLARPMRLFTDGVRRSGADRHAPPVPETGPQELRTAIQAFNTMQEQIRNFVDDRTIMLAAISHDLRTPLTKIRLRGEFIEDEDQRARLFRDVDDLQAMADAALSFFRDDHGAERSTDFDFPALLRTIVDDYGDQGASIAYTGPDQAVFHGRPFALKRACSNLIGNAVRHGKSPRVELICSSETIVLVITDEGSGIPQEALERVFAPFFRLHQARSTSSGGMGLGLTSARSVVRSHGGDVALRNRAEGGLEVRVTLPVIS